MVHSAAHGLGLALGILAGTLLSANAVLAQGQEYDDRDAFLADVSRLGEVKGISFDDIPSGTDITGTTVLDAQFDAPDIGCDNVNQPFQVCGTVWPSGQLIVITGFAGLPATTGSKLLSPGGASLDIYDTAEENDDLRMSFATPVRAFGLDVVFAALDQHSLVGFRVFASDNTLLHSRGSLSISGDGTPGARFVGFISEASDIARVEFDEYDECCFGQDDQHIGYDSILYGVERPPFEVVFGTSWDGISLQDVLDAEYGAGAIDAETDYEGYDDRDAMVPYWEDLGFDGIIVREIAGYQRTNTLGWYEETGFMPVDGGVVFSGPMQQNATAMISFPAGLTSFGFYLNPNGPGDSHNAPEPELFFTNRFFNDIGPDGGGLLHGPDNGDPQCLVYNITRLRGGVKTYVLAWEDLDFGSEVTPQFDTNGTDNDFQDLVVEVTAMSPVPAPACSWGSVKAQYGQ